MAAGVAAAPVEHQRHCLPPSLVVPCAAAGAAYHTKAGVAPAACRRMPRGCPGPGRTGGGSGQLGKVKFNATGVCSETRMPPDISALPL